MSAWPAVLSTRRDLAQPFPPPRIQRPRWRSWVGRYKHTGVRDGTAAWHGRVRRARSLRFYSRAFWTNQRVKWRAEPRCVSLSPVCPTASRANHGAVGRGRCAQRGSYLWLGAVTGRCAPDRQPAWARIGPKRARFQPIMCRRGCVEVRKAPAAAARRLPAVRQNSQPDRQKFLVGGSGTRARSCLPTRGRERRTVRPGRQAREHVGDSPPACRSPSTVAACRRGKPFSKLLAAAQATLPNHSR